MTGTFPTQTGTVTLPATGFNYYEFVYDVTGTKGTVTATMTAPGDSTGTAITPVPAVTEGKIIFTGRFSNTTAVGDWKYELLVDGAVKSTVTLTTTPATTETPTAAEKLATDLGTGAAVDTENKSQVNITAAITTTADILVPTGVSLVIAEGATFTNAHNITNKGTITGAITGTGSIWSEFGSTALVNTIAVVGGANPIFTLVGGTEIHIILNPTGQGYDVRQTDVGQDVDDASNKVVTLTNDLTLDANKNLYVKNGLTLEIASGKKIIFADALAGLEVRANAKITNIAGTTSGHTGVTINAEGIVTGYFDATGGWTANTEWAGRVKI